MLSSGGPSRVTLLCCLLHAVLATTHMESVLLGLGRPPLSRKWQGCPSIGQSWRQFYPLHHSCMGKAVCICRAYGPGEFRIMTSTDGGNFQESAGWRSASREEESYREIVMFDSPKKVKALQVVMRSPRSSGYFGINDISLLTQPGPSMLVSDSAAHRGESCLTTAAGSIT